MRTTLFWFRNDLRLHDQRALKQAIEHAQAHQQALLLVYVHEPEQDEPTAWGFRRMGAHRRRFVADTLQDLQKSLEALGQRLVLLHGPVAAVLPACTRRVQADTVFCEDIAAPEEQAQVQALTDAGLTVKTLWQSSLIEPDALPFAAEDMPQVFTVFRQRIESARLQPLAPLPAPSELPAPPDDTLATLPGIAERFGVTDGSGTTFVFTNYLSKVSPEFKSAIGEGTAVKWPTGVGGKGNEGVANYVQKINGSIGYVEYAYAKQNKMSYVQLKNAAGSYVSPDDANFKAAAAGADWSKSYYQVLTEQPEKLAAFHAEVERIVAIEGLSKNVYELATRALT